MKLKIYNTILIKSIGSFTDIGNLTDIERSIDIDNASRNKEADHLPCEDFEKVDHLL